MSSVQPSSQKLGLFGSLWRRMGERRRRRRIRRLAQVRFRLTREGANLLFIVVFIFLGAVLRNISLLILIATAMIGLLLLQWRFNIATVAGLQAKRRLLPRVLQNSPVTCTLTVSNPKRWVGAWLVVAEDTIEQLAPKRSRTIEYSRTVLDEIPPSSQSQGVYQLTFQKRGLYQVGPCNLSTRFPLGLGKGLCTVDIIDRVLVHPRQGVLLPRYDAMLQNLRNGRTRTSSHVGLHEADFYGLRPWTSGDSRRWIHWRTTARLGELSVRQFDRLEQRQSCVLLDLYSDPSTQGDFTSQHCELAISFVATLVASAANNRQHCVSIAIAGDETFSLAGIQSPLLGNTVLDRLSTIDPSFTPDLAAALQPLTTTLVANPHLIVVSTRADASQALQAAFSRLLGPKASTRLHIHWLDVSNGDLEPLFSWKSKESND